MMIPFLFISPFRPNNNKKMKNELDRKELTRRCHLNKIHHVSMQQFPYITIANYFKLSLEHLHPSSKFSRTIRASRRISFKNHFQLHTSGKILQTCFPSTLNHSSYNLKLLIILHRTLQIRDLFKELARSKFSSFLSSKS